MVSVFETSFRGAVCCFVKKHFTSDSDWHIDFHRHNPDLVIDLFDVVSLWCENCVSAWWTFVVWFAQQKYQFMLLDSLCLRWRSSESTAQRERRQLPDGGVAERVEPGRGREHAEHAAQGEPHPPAVRAREARGRGPLPLDAAPTGSAPCQWYFHRRRRKQTSAFEYAVLCHPYFKQKFVLSSEGVHAAVRPPVTALLSQRRTRLVHHDRPQRTLAGRQHQHAETRTGTFLPPTR